MIIATRYQRPGANCALFPAVAEFYPPIEGMTEPTKRFTPTTLQVDEVEDTLPSIKLETLLFDNRPHKYGVEHELEINRRLAQYRRQYYGFYNDEQHPCLFVNFFYFRLDKDKEFATKYPTKTPSWLKYHVLANDGGVLFWFVFYDLTTKRFYNFDHNGHVSFPCK